ncbi:MAG TPA: IclR family transcriptional regulator [Vicinamibacterales bacterium]
MAEPVPALDRALTMLEAIAQSRRGYSVSELSRRLALPKSSAYLILRTLERRGYVQKLPAGGRYRLGAQALALGRSAQQGFDVREAALPALAALASQTSLTAELGTLDRLDAVVIERVESTASVRVTSWIGRRYGATTSALGKALLAFLPDPVFDAQIRPARLPRPTERAITTIGALTRELDRVRELGFAVSDEEEEPGVRSVAAPVLDARHHAMAAIAISGTTWQIPADRVSPLGALVKEMAERINEK